MDFVESLMLNLTLGGLLLYFIAFSPIPLFRPLVLTGLVLLGGILSVLRLARVKLESIQRKEIVYQLLVVALFGIILFLQSVPLTAFENGNVYDNTLHELFAKIIRDNGMMTPTLAPFSSELIIYPQGFSAILAFAYLVLDIPNGMGGFLLTPLLQSLPVLAGYWLGKRICGRTSAGVLFSFTFSVICRWPRLVTWGALPFMFGASLFLFLFPLIIFSHSELRNRLVLREWIIFGLLLGYLGAVSFTAYQMLVVAMWISSFLRPRSSPSISRKPLFRASALTAISLIPLTPSITRFLLSLGSRGLNIGLPQDIQVGALASSSAPQPLASIGTLLAQRFLLEDWLSPYPPLVLLTLALMIGSIVILVRYGRETSEARLALLSPLYGFLSALVILVIGSSEVGGAISSAIVSQVINISEPAILASVLLFVPVAMMPMVVVHQVFRRSKRIGMRLAVIAVLLGLLIAPYASYAANSDRAYIIGQNNLYNILTPQDAEVMAWIHNNLPLNSRILINPDEAGSYIPVLSGRVVVYPFTATRLSETYQKVVSLISSGVLNATTYRDLQQLNITDVYVGASVIPFQGTKWDANLFLSNPNFQLLKNVGAAYLFSFKYLDWRLAMKENFTATALQEWQPANQGAGIGTFQNGTDHAGQSVLVSEALADHNQTFFSSIYRRVYLPSNTGVTISFFIDAERGMGSGDGAAIILSTLDWSKQLSIATPSNGPFPPNSTIILPSLKGQFEIRLDRAWELAHNTSIPRVLFLQFLNYDADGKTNIVQISNLEIRTNDFNKTTQDAMFGFQGDLHLEWSTATYQANKTVIQAPFGPTSGGLLLSVAKESGPFGWASVYRSFNLGTNASDMTLQINYKVLNATSLNDGFGIVISDASWSNQLYLSTSPTVPFPKISLLIPNVGQNVTVDLAKIWTESFHEPMPSTFYLQFMVLDTDVVPDAVLISNVSLTYSGN